MVGDHLLAAEAVLEADSDMPHHDDEADESLEAMSVDESPDDPTPIPVNSFCY